LNSHDLVSRNKRDQTRCASFVQKLQDADKREVATKKFVKLLSRLRRKIELAGIPLESQQALQIKFSQDKTRQGRFGLKIDSSRIAIEGLPDFSI